MSLSDFNALELLSLAFPGETWSLKEPELKIGYLPSKADDYRRRLKEGRAQYPPETGASEQPKKLSTTQKIHALDTFAEKLLSGSIPVADRLIHLRHRARELGLNIRDADLQRKIWEARRRLAGAVEMYRPGITLTLESENWAWEGILLSGDTTLVVALPKLGKTTLLIDGIARWFRGEPEHLGGKFYGPCPPVIIAGTDMPLRRWLLLFARFGLAEQLPDSKMRLLPNGPIRGLYTQEAPIHLDPEGIAKLAEEASRNPRALVLIDSYSKLTAPLGLKEAASDFAGPLGDLQEALAQYGCTLVVIHHSGHGRAGEGAVAASRGTSALPAAVSQVVALSWLNRSKGSKDNRVVLQTEGRGGEPLQLLVEQQEYGWMSHGNAAEVFAEQQAAQAEESLQDRQADALEFIREQWDEHGHRTSSTQLIDVLELKGANAPRKARRTLNQLLRRGLVQSAKETTCHGQMVWYWPAGAVSNAAHGSLGSPLSGLSPVSPSTFGEGGQSINFQDAHKEETARTGGTGGTGLNESGQPLSGLGNDRIACLVNGEAGWSRKAGPMPHLSVYVSHADGRQLAAGSEEVADLIEPLPPGQMAPSTSAGSSNWLFATSQRSETTDVGLDAN